MDAGWTTHSEILCVPCLLRSSKSSSNVTFHGLLRFSHKSV